MVAEGRPAVPKSAAVADRIRARIHDGTLAEGDLVPSTRALAAELGVSRGTVVAAYEQLDGEGYLRARTGAGTRVLGGGPPGRATRVAAAAMRAQDPAGPGRAHVSAPLTADLAPGLPAVTAMSARDWRAAWRHAAAQPFHNAFADPVGDVALRQQIAGQVALARGLDASADDVVVSSGTSDTLSSIGEALRVVLARAPRIAVEDPGYRTGQRALVSAGAEVVAVPVADGGIDLAALSGVHDTSPVDAVLVTPSHQYPLGGSLPVGRRIALVDWAAANGVVVIEDDYDSEFRHRGDPLPALAVLDRAGVVVHVGSFSKTLDPRLRCGFAVLPRAEVGPGGARRDSASPVREALVAVRAARGPAVGEPVQHAIAHLLASGAFRRHLGRVRRDYTHRRDLIATWVEQPDVVAAGIRVLGLEGGLHAVVTWPSSGSVPGTVAQARLLAQGIRVQDLAFYRLAPVPGDAPGLVLGYAAATTLQLAAALAVLPAALRA